MSDATPSPSDVRHSILQDFHDRLGAWMNVLGDPEAWTSDPPLMGHVGDADLEQVVAALKEEGFPEQATWLQSQWQSLVPKRIWPLVRWTCADEGLGKQLDEVGGPCGEPSEEFRKNPADSPEVMSLIGHMAHLQAAIQRILAPSALPEQPRTPDDRAFLERLLSASAPPRLNAVEMARLEAYLKRPVSMSMMQRTAHGDPDTMRERDRLYRLKEIRDFNKALPNMPDNLGDMKDLHLRDAMKLLNTLREWLDFVMWFTIEYPDNQPVRYGWFVVDYPDGKPGNPDLKAECAERVLAGWLYATGDPLTWVTQVAFEGGKEREVDVDRFYGWMGGEVRTLVEWIARKTAAANTAKLPPWYPRGDIFPKGDNLAAVHADYLDMRRAVADYYKQLAEPCAAQPPWIGFPDPVPLPASAQAAKHDAHLKPALLAQPATVEDGDELRLRIVDYFVYKDNTVWKCYGSPLQWKKPSDEKCFEMLIAQPNRWTTRQQHKESGLKDSTIKSAISRIRAALWDVLKYRPEYSKMGDAKGRALVRKTILQKEVASRRACYRLCVEAHEGGFRPKAPPATGGNGKSVKSKS